MIGRYKIVAGKLCQQLILDSSAIKRIVRLLLNRNLQEHDLTIVQYRSMPTAQKVAERRCVLVLKLYIVATISESILGKNHLGIVRVFGWVIEGTGTAVVSRRCGGRHSDLQ